MVDAATGRLMVLALLVTPGVCAKKPARGDAGPVTIASAAASTVVDAGPSPAELARAAAAAAEASRAAAVEKAKTLVADVRWMVTKGVTMNPAKGGEGDVTTKCDALDTTRAGLGAHPDPELVTVLDEGATLCAFDVPLLTANESLDHLRGTPSQASRLLMCDVAAREIGKARAVHANDMKVHRADARRATLCTK
jgi:hypothetical protein